MVQGGQHELFKLLLQGDAIRRHGEGAGVYPKSAWGSPVANLEAPAPDMIRRDRQRLSLGSRGCPTNAAARSTQRVFLKGVNLCAEILTEVGVVVFAGYSIRTITKLSVYTAIREV
jgi:hypothetical protein